MDVDDTQFLQELSRVELTLQARRAVLSELHAQEVTLSHELDGLTARLAEARRLRSEAELHAYTAEVAQHTHLHCAAAAQDETTHARGRMRRVNAKRERCSELLADAISYDGTHFGIDYTATAVEVRAVRSLFATLSKSYQYRTLVSAAAQDRDSAATLDAVIRARLGWRPAWQTA